MVKVYTLTTDILKMKLSMQFLYNHIQKFICISYTNINSKWIKDLNVRAETIKLENKGVNLHDHGLGNGFLGMTPKAQAAKEKTRKAGHHQN